LRRNWTTITRITHYSVISGLMSFRLLAGHSLRRHSFLARTPRTAAPGARRESSGPFFLNSCNSLNPSDSFFWILPIERCQKRVAHRHVPWFTVDLASEAALHKRGIAHSPALLPPGNVLLSFAPVDHESVVIAVESPRTWRNFGCLYKPPIRCVRRFQTEVIPHCR
jgi:hypothetical protein